MTPQTRLCCIMNNVFDHVCAFCGVGWCDWHASSDHFQGFGNGNASHDECRPRVSFEEFMKHREVR